MDEPDELRRSASRALTAYAVLFLIAWQWTGAVVSWWSLLVAPIAIIAGVARPNMEPGDSYYDV